MFVFCVKVFELWFLSGVFSSKAYLSKRHWVEVFKDGGYRVEFFWWRCGCGEAWAYCHNPSLGLGTKARGCKVAAQVGDPGALHMLPGVQRVWGNEPSHSQVNSHVGSWTPERTPKSSERDCRGQNASSWRVLYIIGKLLKCRCLKWARMAHLDIWNTSYGQKKGRESI
jgi:hypothetical protein